MGGDKLGNHYLRKGAVHLAFKAQVAVGDHANQHLVLIHDGDAADAVLIHQLEGILDQSVLGQSHGVDNHTVLSTFYLTHLVGLTLNRHILVQHAEAALLRHSDSHSSLGHRVHGCRHQRHVQVDVARKAGCHRHFAGNDFRIGRDKQHIIVCEAFADEFGSICKHNYIYLFLL